MSHYFSAAEPDSAEEGDLTVMLAGREVVVRVAGGVFSPRRLDLGTSVLLREVRDDQLPERARILDLGCGWGPIALTAALAHPTARVTAVDVNPRAVALTASNARRLGVEIEAVEPDDVDLDARFDAIWSNPPIRIGKAALHEMLERWLARLSPTGVAHLVVQRNLGADSLQSWLTGRGFATVRRASAKGYRVLRVSARTSYPEHARQ